MNTYQIKNDEDYDAAVDYLRAVEKIEIRDMSRAMFKFLRSKANAVYRYLNDVCVTDCNAEFINRFLFRVAAPDYLDPRSYHLKEAACKKQRQEERQKWLTDFAKNPIDLENF